jgi:hypothetical protein
MSVFAFPPTPQKTPTSASASAASVGISTQILPLSRLSLSGASNCSTSPPCHEEQVTML